MRAVRLVFRCELRRRWASWLALALLVALVGGTVLAGASAGRRTASAFPDYVARYGFDSLIFASSTLPAGGTHLPGEHVVLAGVAYFNGNGSAGGQVVPANDLALLSLPVHGIGHMMKLISGRLPAAPDEALAGFSMQQQYGLHVGSIVSVPLYQLSQRQEVLNSNGTPTPHGPTANLRIVGFEVSMLDFPSNSSSYTIMVGPAFDTTTGRRVLAATYTLVKLAHGAADLPRFTYEINHLQYTGGNFAYIQSEDAQIAAIEDSIHPQALGWWLFALLVGLAGLALVAQALSRQSIVEREQYPTLAAVGVSPPQIFWLGMLRAAAIGVVGAAGAVALAVAVSPLTPIGEARAAEPTQGFVVDALVVGLGAAAIVAAVMLLSIFPAWRASQVRATGLAQARRASSYRPSHAVRLLSRMGATPSAIVGTSHALERGRGRSSVPVISALVGTTAAVAALAATMVFGASLNNLLSTPRLYGLGWQVDIGALNYQQVHALAARLAGDPGVSQMTYGINGKYIDVNGAPVQAVLVVAAKGPLVFSIIDGRDPRGVGEIALGTQTLAAAHAAVGSKVAVSIIGPTGRSRTSKLTVVGTAAFPPNLSAGGLGTGAIVTLQGAAAAVCGTGPASAGCVRGLYARVETTGDATWGTAIAVAPGPAGRVAALRLERAYAQDLTVLARPTNLVNFGQAINFPALLGATLALFGAATLAHLLLVTAARRRREIALLKVLGFVRRQVASMVRWQATTVALIGIVVGTPCGIVLGGAVWRAFAANLGAVPVAVVPVGLVAVVAALVVVGGNVIAIVPAAIAVRFSPAEALREQ